MTENKRFYLLNYNNHPIYDSLLDEEYNAQFKKQREKICDLLNELNRLAEANEEQGLAIMTYLHDNHYEVWEEVNKEVFKE